MTKYPFTETGVQELTKALYNLPDEELEEEAGLLRLNIRGWMGSHFELSPSQLEDLEKMTDEALDFISFNAHIAVGNRLPVYLNKKQARGDDPILKTVETDSNIAVATNSNEGYLASGDLTIKISYTN